MDADIVVGEGQSIGVGLQFGGPYVGLFGCKQKYVRQMPGRLCGETVDADGKRGFVLTLSTREQHIRSEEHTSELQSLMRISYAVFCLKQQKHKDLMIDTSLTIETNSEY